MSDHQLPKTVDPLKYADQNKVLEGFVEVDQLPRLVETLAGDQGRVAVSLEFDRDEQNLRVLRGQLKTDVAMTCQRCLQPVDKTIESDFTLGIVLTDDDAKNLPRRYEPLLVDPETLVLRDVIEEELILSLPMFAYHEQCAGDYVQAQDEGQGEQADETQSAAAEDEAKPNPFSVLSELKLKK